jgi:ribose-phosphate pyrophosphokinase
MSEVRTVQTNRGALSIMACDSGRPFAKRIINELNKVARENYEPADHRLKYATEVLFPNEEVKVVIEENIRGDDLYIVQAIDDPCSEKSVNDNLMAVLTAVHAAFQSDAEHISVVLPQFPYSRQERRKTREAITAKLVAGMLEMAGARRVITLDIHSEAIQGFFNYARLEDLHASRVFLDYLQEIVRIDPTKLVCTSPDVGSVQRARHYAKRLGSDLAIVDKSRDYSKVSTIASMRLVGNVKGKEVLLVDDIIATGGTLVNALRLLKDNGAEKITVLASLPFFSGNCKEKLDRAYEEGLLDQIIGTDAVFHGKEFVESTPWYHEISVAPLFARVIYNINMKQSVSELLK